MASPNSIASISSKLCRKLFSTRKNSSPFTQFSKSFSTTDSSSPSTITTTPEYTSDLDELSNSDTDTPTESIFGNSPELDSPSSRPQQRFDGLSRVILEDGLDVGIYKAIIVGQVGQKPVQKRLKNGRSLTLTTVGTGGIRNERIPFPSEEPREYANRSTIQWHRVSIFPDRLGDMIMKHAQPGVLLYLEGNIETKIFTDPTTGLVRRIREIAIRQNGRIVFLGNGSDFSQPSPNELRGVGYF